MGGLSTLPDYRLGELSRVSGVSTRNIRAYRERGLLDPPRRAGRAAMYDDHHLAQLQTISQLLRRGFTSAHIAEFFEVVRRGGDLVEFLGLRQRIVADDLQPDEAAALLRAGLVRRSGAELVWANPVIGAGVACTGDLRFMVQVVDAVDADLRRAADEVAAAVDEATAPGDGDGDDEASAGRLQDRRQLGRLVAAGRFDDILTHRLGGAGG